MSLAYGVPPAKPNTLYAHSTAGGIKVAPKPGQTVRFGRGSHKDERAVDLRVGIGDQQVSRQHGELTYRQGHWWLRNIGQQLLRLPRGQLMHTSTEPVPLAAGYTPLFVKGSGYREHVVELYVTDHDVPPPDLPYDATTRPPKRWSLSDDERLVLVALGQRYLLYEADPRPLTYRETAAELECLRPEAVWGQRWADKRSALTAAEFRKRLEKKVERTVEKVRNRLEKSGDFAYDLRLPEPGGPCDDTLKRNLLRGLVESTTLVPPDLALLDDDVDKVGG